MDSSNGPNTATIVNVNAFNSHLTDLASGTYVFRWVISNGLFCPPNQDEVIVRVADQVPDDVDAGADQSVCSNSPIYLDGNTPILNEVGTWSSSPVGVNFSDVNDPRAVIVNGLAPGVYTLTWTIVNGCGEISDDVTITVNTEVGAKIADAGDDVCDLSGATSWMLNGNAPAGSEMGLWTQVGTTPSIADFDDNTQFNTGVSNLVAGTYQFVWTLNTGNGCVPSSDTVTITLGSSIMEVSAGDDFFACLPTGGGNVMFDAEAVPGSEIGTWVQIYGPGGFTIVDVNDPQSLIENMSDGSYSFEWVVEDGACILSRDTVYIYIATEPIPADAGPGQSICGGNMAVLAANSVGNGIWTVISGPNTPTFSSITNPTATISNLLMGTYQLQWNSFSTSPICPSSTDIVIISVIPTAQVGADEGFCQSTNTFNLVGNPESIGVWTLSSQPVGASTIITQTSSNTATASGMTEAGAYTFTYTIDGGGMCESSDDITVVLFGVPNEAFAGGDQLLCNELTFALEGNAADPGFNGVWTQVEGPTPISFTPNANDPTAEVEVPSPGVYVFEWTISNGNCESSDQVRIEDRVKRGS